MLYSMVLHFSPQQDLPLHSFPGASLHGFFFRLFQAADAAYAELLHNTPGPRPFTLSPIYGRSAGYTLPAHTPCRVRFTLLAQQAFANISRLFTGYVPMPEELHINGVPVTIEKLVTLPQMGSQWAGCSDYVTLWENAGQEEEITLLFASPTTFRQGNINIPLPLPRLVFASLARKWQHFAPEYPLHPDLNSFVEECVFPARYQLETRTLDYGRRRKYVGFTGRCTFGVLPEGRWREAGSLLIRQLNLLADFAFYAGVGQKTTMGMGQCRRLITQTGRHGDVGSDG
ncbi:MAG: CRISPR system precrRNA processing endoribonuclease RAMP protein Cas6 [Desulfurispora sp.]|uniref:CRISPR system precrRNA processing endoribonuclease RAMP protein Cas6 n=1 Tax=Desulfurispora sp. TaxID=3014275 RepID=UPI004049D325